VRTIIVPCCIGEFELKPKENCCSSFAVSSIGYQPLILQSERLMTVITLQPNSSVMETVVTANRETIKRSLAPVSINVISSKVIKETKPITVDQVLNKVSGVY